MSNEHRRRIDRVLDADFATELDQLELAELRERRRLADDLETELSFYRRLLHGRMDLLQFELNRRTGDETRSLIEALPDILGAGERAGGFGGRLPSMLAPELPEERRRPIDRVLQDDFLARLPALEEEELREIQGTLADAEHEVSAQRKAAQQAFDALQAEITRRYKEGQARPEQLLAD